MVMNACSKCTNEWYARVDSNYQSSDYRSDALTIKLRAYKQPVGMDLGAFPPASLTYAGSGECTQRFPVLRK
jgi:hypothetical protein